MKLKMCYLCYLIAFLFLLSGIALSAPQKPSTTAEIAVYKGADRQQILEEGAKKEGKLTLYTVEILAQTLRPKLEIFKKKYSFIKVDVWRAPDLRVTSRLFEEYKAGRKIVDVICTTQAGVMVIEQMKILQAYYSPNVAHIEDAAIKMGPDGTGYSAGFYESIRGIGYNPSLIGKNQVPKTYQELLDPKWKGKLAIAGSMSGVGWMGTILETFGEKFVEQLARQDFDVHMVSARALLDMVIAGEYMFSPTISNSHVFVSKQKGATAEWVPIEPAHAHLVQIMLPESPPNIHAALLFIDFNLSKEVGEMHIANGYGSPRKDLGRSVVYKRGYGPYSRNQLTTWKKMFDKLFLTK
ncbi:ABC transporter substrate-binding protein [Thermodesulfobacteriota bacterium]